MAEFENKAFELDEEQKTTCQPENGETRNQIPNGHSIR